MAIIRVHESRIVKNVKRIYFSILSNFNAFHVWSTYKSLQKFLFAKCIWNIQKRQKVVWIETASTFIGKSDDIRILESVECIIHYIEFHAICIIEFVDFTRLFFSLNCMCNISVTVLYKWALGWSERWFLAVLCQK